MEIMKCNGSIIEVDDNIDTYEWVINDTTYWVTFDKDGDLYGIETNGISQDILDRIVNEPYAFDFPATYDEYMELDKRLNS